MAFDNLTRDEAQTRARLISNVAYRVSLDLTTGSEDFGCDTKITFDSLERGASTFLDLIAKSVEMVVLNGREITPRNYDGHRIPLDALEPQNELRIAATCVYEHDGIGLHRFEDPVDGRVYLHTQGEPFDIHRMYPCFDQPDIKGTFELEVKAADGWEVVSNSPPVARPDQNGNGSWRFATTPLIPTYISALVAGPYRVVRDRYRDIDLGLYCRESLFEYLDADEFFEITKQGFEFFEEVFAYPYPFGKYDQLFVPEFNAGAMENSGCVTFSENYLFRSKVTESARERRADVILHEMSHMWFGDLVTMRWWDDLWLNESFATFMASLAQHKATRFKNAWVTFATSLKAGARRQDQLPSTHPIAADIPDIATCRVSFDGITYSKGASVLRQLVAWAGEDLFIEGIRNYFRKHEYGNTELTDFLSSIEETCGRDLHAWSKEWLETAGLNTFRPEVEIEGDEIKKLSIRQDAPPNLPTLRRHRVAVGLYDVSSDGSNGSNESLNVARRRRFELDVRGDLTEVAGAAGEKVPDLILINDGDLTYAKIRLDDRSLKTTSEKLRYVSDPLARALLWAAAWDMCRDAEIPSREFLNIVLSNIDGESDIGVVQRLQDHAQEAIVFYGDPSNYILGLETLATTSHERLHAYKPGSDLQLVWARTLVTSARTSEHTSLIRGWLDGKEVPEGLHVDFDLRWSIVRSLAALAVPDEWLIDEELDRDPTDLGKRQAAAARAGIPTREAKSLAWDLALDPKTPYSTARAVMGGFHRTDQHELLEMFVTRYFEDLESVWQSRDLEVAIAIAGGLYPIEQVSEQTTEATDEHLKRDLPAPIRRVLIEKKDEVERAMRTRAKDAKPF